MKEYGGPTELAKKLGHKSGSQLSQIAGPNPTRPIGERLARQIEQALDLPTAWLDRRHDATEPPASAINEDLLTRCVAAVQDKVRGLPKGRMNTEKFSAIVALVYERARVTGQVDESHLLRILTIAM